MNIIAFALMFIWGSIMAALEGDFSGLSAIGRFCKGFGLFFGIGCLLIGFSKESTCDVFLMALAAYGIGWILCLPEKIKRAE